MFNNLNPTDYKNDVFTFTDDQRKAWMTKHDAAITADKADTSKGAGQAKDEKKKDEKTLAEVERGGHGGGHGGGWGHGHGHGHGWGRGGWGGAGWGGYWGGAWGYPGWGAPNCGAYGCAPGPAYWQHYW